MNTGLILTTCPHCDGEGAEVYAAGPGYRSPYSGSYLPFEYADTCEVCEGAGEVEVCAHCLEPLEVVRGEEVCGCVALSIAPDVPQAA